MNLKKYIAGTFVFFSAVVLNGHALEVTVGDGSNQLDNMRQQLLLDGVELNIDDLYKLISNLEDEIEELKKKSKRIDYGTVVKPADKAYSAYVTTVTFSEPFESRPDVFIDTEEHRQGSCKGYTVGGALVSVSNVTKTGFKVTMPGVLTGCEAIQAKKANWVAVEVKVPHEGCAAQTVSWSGIGAASCKASIASIAHGRSRTITDPNKTVSIGDTDSYGSATLMCQDGKLVVTDSSCVFYTKIPTCAREPDARYDPSTGSCKYFDTGK